MGTKGVHGEGNYEATRQYNESTKRFVDAGKVDKAARDAAPHSPEEAQQMKQAEQAALLRAKESPPAVKEPPEEKDPAIDEPVRDTAKPAQGKRR
jgi:hypothetical protein